MRWRRDALLLRLMGCLFGIFALGIGLISPANLSADQVPNSEFAVIFIVTGLIALIGSLVTTDIRSLWFCTPERSKLILRNSGNTLKQLIFGGLKRDRE